MAHSLKPMGELTSPLPIGPNGENTHLPRIPKPPAPFQNLPTNPANLILK
jgi:hypothetical protein